MKRILKAFSALCLAALVGCGGGGGDAGTNPNSPVSPVKPVASLDYQLDKSTITNSGADEATIVVTALDASNNPVSGAALTVALDSGIYTPLVASTDASGRASGKISTGSNKANRNIGFTVTLGGKTTVGVLPVTGSQITFSTIPGAPAPNAKTSISVKVTDVNSVGISNTTVSFGGTLGFTGSVKTDMAGVAKCVIGRFQLDFFEGFNRVVYRNVERIGIILFVGYAGKAAVLSLVHRNEASA